MNIEGGLPIDKCWASEGGYVCDVPKVNRIGLCLKHAQEVCGPGLIRA